MKICMISYSQYEFDNRVHRYGESLIKRGDDVDVMESRRCLGFSAESGYVLLGGGYALAKYFQGHSSVQRELVGLIDGAHAPPAYRAHDLEVTEAFALNFHVAADRTRPSSA